MSLLTESPGAPSAHPIPEPNAQGVRVYEPRSPADLGRSLYAEGNARELRKAAETWLGDEAIADPAGAAEFGERLVNGFAALEFAPPVAQDLVAAIKSADHEHFAKDRPKWRETSLAKLRETYGDAAPEAFSAARALAAKLPVRLGESAANRPEVVLPLADHGLRLRRAGKL